MAFFELVVAALPDLGLFTESPLIELQSVPGGPQSRGDRAGVQQFFPSVAHMRRVTFTDREGDQRSDRLHSFTYCENKSGMAVPITTPGGIIDAFGGNRAVASLFGVVESAVSNWRGRGFPAWTHLRLLRECELRGLTFDEDSLFGVRRRRSLVEDEASAP